MEQAAAAGYRTLSSSGQRGAGGSQSMPRAGAGSSSQRGVVCPHAHFLDAQERGSVPQRCPQEHVPVHVRCVHRPGSREPSPAEH